MSNLVNLNYISDRQSWARKEGNIYIGRGTRELPPSKWGNPYKVGTQKGRYSQKEAVLLYEAYILASDTLRSSLCELQGKSLGCWCVPDPCHGEVLLRMSNMASTSSTISTSTTTLTPTTTVHITEHETSPTMVTSSAYIIPSNTSTTFSRSYEQSVQVTGPRTRSSTAQGSMVQSSYMKIKVSPGKVEPVVPIESAKSDVVAKQSLEELFSRVAVLESQVWRQQQYELVQDNLIRQLEKKITTLEGKQMLADARLSVRDHVVEGLKGEIKRLQQYTRRYSVTVSGIEKNRQEKPEELREKVLKLVREVKSTTGEQDIDKFHRNGRIYDNDQDVIIRFKSHAAKEAFYKARKTLPPTWNNTKIRPSLCPNQKTLLHKAQSMIEEYNFTHEHINPPEFVFANIHGELQVKFKSKSRFGLMATFHDIKQLIYIIQEAQAVKPTDDEYERISSWADKEGIMNLSANEDDADDMGFSQMQ